MRTKQFKIVRELVGHELRYVVYERLPWYVTPFTWNRWVVRGSNLALADAKNLMENYRQRGEVVYED